MSESIHPAADKSVRPSRRSVLTKASWAGLAAIPAIGVFMSKAEAYTGKQSTLDANDKEAFRDIKKHENAHVAYLVKALGSKARPKPTFKGLTTSSFGEFVTLSRAFEITGVGAYLGALPAISSKAYVAAAGSIALIEGRHSGFLSVFSGKDVTLQAATGTYSDFDMPLTIKQVVTAVSPFIVSLNGGPAASFTEGDDVSILNFALLLEYLEAEFYNINTEKYVGKD